MVITDRDHESQLERYREDIKEKLEKNRMPASLSLLRHHLLE
jgi:hypothetical protein